MDAFDVEHEAVATLFNDGRLAKASQRGELLLRRRPLSLEREWMVAGRLSSCYLSTREPAKALPHARRVVELADTLFGPTSLQYANARNALGMVYTEMRRFAHAERELQAAMSVMERRGEQHGAAYSGMLLAMAAVEYEQRRFEHQLEWLLRARTLLQALQPEQQRSYGVALNDLALCYARLQRPEEARAHYVEALTLVERSVGCEHPDFATALSNYAVFFDELLLYDDAIPLLERSLRVYVHTLGQRHQHAVITQTWLNHCYECAAKVQPLWGTGTRWRLCAGCDGFIDRMPLEARGSDHLVCGACTNVAYCSQVCVDTHWPHHEPVCGQRTLRARIVNIYAPDACAWCLYAGATQRCATCRAVRYCGTQCQQSHWKTHQAQCCRAPGPAE